MSNKRKEVEKMKKRLKKGCSVGFVICTINHTKKMNMKNFSKQTKNNSVQVNFYLWSMCLVRTKYALLVF
jgi:hypothetical protein